MLYELGRALSRVAATLAWRLRVRGRRHLPARGGAILASNHQSFLDVLVIATGSPRPVGFMARSTLFRPGWCGVLLRDLGVVPVGRDRPGPSEMRTVLERLAGGGLMVVFPEGSRTTDGSLGEMRGGVAFLARRAGVPVVPVLVQGAFEAWPRGRRFPGTGRIRVAFGRPVRYPESWEDREVAADLRRRLLVLRDGPVMPQPAPDRGGAARAPREGEGAA